MTSDYTSFLRRVLLVLFAFVLLLPFGMSGAALAQTNSPATGSANQAGNANQTVLNETDQYRVSPVVVSFGAMLGMKPETAANVFTIFNLLILVVAVGYGLRKILPGAFQKRTTAIQKHLVDARTATEEATARLSSVEERLAKLDGQIEGMRAQAEADSLRDEQRIKAALEDEQEKILAAAESDIQNATTLARREIQRYAAQLAVEHAARNLHISPDTDRALLSDFAHKLGERTTN